MKVLFKTGKAYPNTKRALQSTQETFQHQVKNKLLVLKEEFQNWERLFFVKNGLCTPTIKDVANDFQVTSLLDKIRVSNKLIKSWNI